MPEIEMIERARERKRKEAALPPVHDRAGFDKRLKMLEEMELEEWVYREKQMKRYVSVYNLGCAEILMDDLLSDRLQEARIAVLKEIFRNRQIETDKVNQERIEQIWQRKLAEKDAIKAKSERKKRMGTHLYSSSVVSPAQFLFSGTPNRAQEAPAVQRTEQEGRHQ